MAFSLCVCLCVCVAAEIINVHIEIGIDATLLAAICSTFHVAQRQQKEQQRTFVTCVNLSRAQQQLQQQ